MRTAVSFSVLFYLRTGRLKDGKAPLMARITVNKARKNISLKYQVEVNKWNGSKQIVTGASPETKSLNKYIAEVRTELHNVYRQLQIDKKPISAEVIKSLFLNQEEDSRTVNQIIQYHNDTMKDHLSWGTAKNYYTTQKYITEFLKKKLKINDISLQQLNYKFLSDFEMFLRTHVPGENQKPCGNNTVMKHIERFRKIISMAVRNEWLKVDPFVKFKPKFIRKERGFLTDEELRLIETKEISIARVEVVRDLFVFSCYTGLAYRDSYNLTADQIQLGINGKKWIILNRQKTGIQASVPLLPKAIEIIEKYKDHPRCKESGKLLPMISNQPFNYILKEIAVSCGITKNLSHHLARHTFATTVCLMNGISMEGLMKMLGHNKISTTQVYGKVLPQRISNEMELLEKKLSAQKVGSIHKTGT
jgi:site-specific recombinase XerD